MSTSYGRRSAVADVPLTAEIDAPTMGDVLAELRAIRTLLERQDAEQALCPHGGRGLCMSCITPQIAYALNNLTREISNSAWEAMRRG